MNYFHPIVWQLLSGMVFARTASFMTLPFLAIYMQGELGASPILIGIAVGVAPLASTFGGFVGGYLTDRVGRKIIILVSMASWSIAFFGFAFAHTAWLFIVLNAINGLSRAFFEPSSQALMIDYTPNDKRRRLFSIRYTFINLSAVVGPLLGVFIANMSTMTLPFMITGSLYIFCFFFFFVVLRNVKEVHTNKTSESPLQLAKVLIQDRILLFMVLGSVFASFVYSQTDATLSQLLNDTMEDGIILFSVLIAINAFTVMVLQLPLSILTEKLPVKSSITLGSVLTIIGAFFFYIANSWTMYIVAMIFISLAEIFIWPLIGVVIEMIAPEHQKATYIGVMQFQSLGGFVGPIVGGWMLTHFVGEVYLIVTFAAICMLGCYLLALRGKQDFANR